MYYKITNPDSPLFQSLYALRKEEKDMDERNIQAINEKIGLRWESFLGTSSQQTWNRVPSYEGFAFLEPEKVDLKTWQHLKNDPTCFVPNKRTKKGRDMADFLSRLERSCFKDVFDPLGINITGRFSLPFLEIGKDGCIVLWLGDKQRPEHPDLIEITSKEFEQLY